MKKLYFLLTLLISTISFGQDLLITGIIDGPLPGGLPKGIELYVVNNIADMSIYGIEIAGNGGASTGIEYTFPADSYSAGDFIYITKNNSSGTDASDAFLQYFGFAATYQDNVASHNGDDTIILFKNGTIVDSIGEIGVDGTGKVWESKDGWGYRKDGQGPNATFDAAEWTFSGVDAVDGCDELTSGQNNNDGTNAQCSSVFPVGTYSPTASTAATIDVTSPTDNQVFASATINVNVEFTTANLGAFQVDMEVTKNGGAASTSNNVTSPFMINGTADGDTFVVVAKIMDGATVVHSETVNFSISYPCDLIIGTVTTTCDATTPGTDTYTTTIDFTGGGSSTYTITNGGLGTIGGDNPNSTGSGQIVITGVDEGVPFTINVLGDSGSSSCNIDTNVIAPICVTATCAAVGSIIITEIMQNPKSPINDDKGEWFELHNTTASAIDVQGWDIKDDDKPAEKFTIPSSIVIPAGGYVILSRNGDTNTNGGLPTVDFTYGNLTTGDTVLTLGNGADGLTINCSGTLIDAVIWDGGTVFPDPNGKSMSLKVTHFNASDNDDGANWEEVAFTYGGDGQLGTPGGANDTQLSVKYNEIHGFSVYPNPITNGSFMIRTSNNDDKLIRIYNLLGKKIITKTVHNNTLIDISNLSTGVYILKVNENGKLATRKLVVQ